MLEARHLDKYFNRKKPNAIHVINDTSLKLPEKGLVCLLGPSGSGKTTLLNVLGGLDKADSGEIVFKDHVLKRYSAGQWDAIRSRHFGYVFQNYALLPELSVHENLEFVLRAFNLPKEEIDARIDYALAAVGMEKYKKRKAGQLSGGQQQRVAIARALVKSPDVVVADEPTGNLDEKNTTQVMNIIKKISRDCLVVLVTHERRLAEFYGDVIYEIADGSIVQERTVSEARTLQQLDDRNIYLRDFRKEEVETEALSIKYYYDDEKPKIALNIIYRDGIFYINSENAKLRVVDRDSEIKVVDSKRPVIKTEEIEDFDYHLPAIGKVPKRNVFGLKHVFRSAFAHLGGLRRRQKFIYFVMFLTAVMVTLGFINFFMAKRVREENFLFFNRNLVQVGLGGIKTPAGIEELLEATGADYALPLTDERLYPTFRFDFYRQTSGTVYQSMLASLMPVGSIENQKLVMGRMPENRYEVLLDDYLAEGMLDDYLWLSKGIVHKEQLLEVEFLAGDRTYKIVGIVENNNPHFYFLDWEFKSLTLTEFLVKGNLFPLSESGVEYYYEPEDLLNNIENDIKKPVSELDLKEDEAIVSLTFYENRVMGGKFSLYPFNKEYRVVGVIPGSDWLIHLNDSQVNELYMQMLIRQEKIAVYGKDKKAVLSRLQELDIEAEDMYARYYEREQRLTFSPLVYTFSLLIISGSSVFLYFLMRSRLISRVYEIGVYRALGVRKSNIYRMFFAEILILTAFSAILGIGIVTYFVSEVNSLYPVVYYPWFLPVLSFVLLLGVNETVGLLPVWNLLRLTPAQIMSKYDI